MFKTKRLMMVLTILALSLLAACAGTKKVVHLQPGEQIADSEVDMNSNSITQESDDVIVKVKAAMMPIERKTDLYPTFWITIENTGDDKVIFKPAEARLIDVNGNQYEPLPVSVRESRTVVGRYWIPDPLYWSRFSWWSAWPYYPMFPYRVRSPRARFYSLWYYDPFWDYRFDSVWLERVKLVKTAAKEPDKTETIYSGAKLTYVLVFPRLNNYSDTLRLIVPNITTWQGTEKVASKDFELIFEQDTESASK